MTEEPNIVLLTLRDKDAADNDGSEGRGEGHLQEMLQLQRKQVRK